VLRFLVILIAPLALVAADNWRYFQSGPFEVYSAAGNAAGRKALNELEQLRNALRLTLGGEELHSVWPIRLLVFDSERDAAGSPLGSFHLARDAWVGATVRGRSVPLAACVRILLDANTRRMPSSVEQGLISLFSTLRVDGTVVVLGDPVPASSQTDEWSTVHFLTVSPQYGGRAPAFFANLQQGADWSAAYWNAFSRTPEQMENEASHYLAAGVFGTRKVSGAPIDPERQFRPGDVDDLEISVALADLLEGAAAQAAYSEVISQFPESAEALEGLDRFAEAVAAGSISARCLLRYGLTFQDTEQAADAFRKAADLNPLWGEPHYQLALLESNPAQKSRLLTEATELDPRNVGYWRELAETYLTTDSYREAGRAWAGAESAAENEQERERIRLLRRQVEQQREDYLAEQRRLERENREREMARLQEEAVERIRAAERAFNASDPERPEGRPIVEWWEDPRPRRSAVGALERVDCLRGGATLHLRESDGSNVTLQVSVLTRLVILGDEQALSCGPQQPPREVEVQYFAWEGEGSNAAGEAVAVEFR